MTNNTVLFLEDISEQAVGGKAEGLAKLTQMGLNVPQAFVICNAQENSYPAELEQHYQTLGGAKVAVRSSAIGEDGSETSFAGQYETILDVSGIEALKMAISQCVASLENERATAYQNDRADIANAMADTSAAADKDKNSTTEITMCVVVQRMVDAKTAGVLFTADPVSGRHDRLVIDAVAGLGEALVSGEVTPDHYQFDHVGNLLFHELTTDQALVSEDELQQLHSQALEAAQKYTQTPNATTALLDMEWAIDQSGELFWLQARPITTLGSDLNELDTPIPADYVITRCNVGEMMPGAVCPLTFSVQGRAIEHGMQFMHQQYANRPAINSDWSQINLFFGHMFINMTGGLQAAKHVSINTPESMAQSVCGGPIAELKAPDDLAPIWRRWWGTVKFARFCFGGQKALTEFETRFRHAYMAYTNNSLSMMPEIDRYFPWICETNQVHLRCSALSGVMEGVVQSFVKTGDRSAAPSNAEQAEAARLLSGADNVESAVMVERLDNVADAIAENDDAEQAFCQASPGDALNWLESENAAAAQKRFAEFLDAHGHRCIRELCVREQGWIDDKEKIIVSLQVSVKARIQGNYTPRTLAKVDTTKLPKITQTILPIAHAAIRRREHTKSLLVLVTHRLKRAYRHLASLLVKEGHLPDSDLVFFFSHDELKEFVQRPTAEWVEKAKQRRIALSFHEKMEFEDIYVGKPEPIRWQAANDEAEGQAGVLSGRPVSQGIVEGIARVALTIDEAAKVEAGEILIAPITDIGWTPYFSVIAGLATDVGSAVSHGAVIAREYGLPAIVNLRRATKVFVTGDRVRLDADKGLLTKITD